MTRVMIWDIENKIHKYQKYIQLNLYLSDILNDESTTIHITQNVHLVNDLHTNLLIEMNIIDPEWISIDILAQKIIIDECWNLLVIINITSQKNDQIH